ncbi:MAG: AMP-binding protein [Dyella sp.]|uniref:AMP-binding protein n=1 Tax=Dyella sp. TaxID=1869338 RepID=UPI003F7FF0A6
MRFEELFRQALSHTETRVSARRADGEDITLSAAQLIDATQALAGKLLESGAKRGMQIALQSSNCYEYLLWDLAALGIGAVIQAIPEDIGAEKLASIAQKQSIALWVLEDESHGTAFANRISLAETLTLQTIALDRDARVLHDDDLLTRVYSSGSSGYLKGLDISRHGTELLVTDFIDAFELGVRDSHLIFLPLSNYQQRMSVYACLWSGASFKLIKHATVFQELARYSPSFLIAPPAIYENLYNLYGKGVGAKEKLNAFLGGNIRFMITGMAPIRRDVQQAFHEQGFLLLEAYGVTETGMIAWNTPSSHRIGAVGRLIYPDHVHFNGESEIVIRRPFPLSKGYFDSADSDSANTFLADGSIATGDIGQLGGDGFLTLRGRKKEVIITSGGAKFHPEELERSLAAAAQVKHTIVLMSKSDGKLVAILVTDDSADADSTARIDDGIRSLNASVPSFMNIHRRIVTHTAPSIDNGMLTRNLKYDRKGIYRHFQADIEMPEGIRQ